MENIMDSIKCTDDAAMACDNELFLDVDDEMPDQLTCSWNLLDQTPNQVSSFQVASEPACVLTNTSVQNIIAPTDECEDSGYRTFSDNNMSEQNEWFQFVDETFPFLNERPTEPVLYQLAADVNSDSLNNSSIIIDSEIGNSIILDDTGSENVHEIVEHIPKVECNFQETFVENQFDSTTQNSDTQNILSFLEVKSEIIAPNSSEQNVQHCILNNDISLTQLPNQKSKDSTPWQPIIPQFIQPSQMIVMNPRKTRKDLTVRHCPTPKKNKLTSYTLMDIIDDKNLNIPMITENSQNNRRQRKQKLIRLPGSCIFVANKTNMSSNSKQGTDPYGDTNAYEVNEIFGRKRKVPKTNGRKLQVNNNNTLHIVKKESRASSFDEKISHSVSNCETKIRMINDDISSSSSENCESADEEGESEPEIGKSLKCQKCSKMFKTNRSLSIHKKQCKEADADDSINNFNQIYLKFAPSAIINEVSDEDSKEMKNDRPRTRSQAKRSNNNAIIE